MAKDFDFTEEVRSLQVPTMIVAADADMAHRATTSEFKLLDGGLRDGGWMGEGRPKGGHALAILPSLTHYNLAVSPLFAATTLAFLGDQPAEGGCRRCAIRTICFMQLRRKRTTIPTRSGRSRRPASSWSSWESWLLDGPCSSQAGAGRSTSSRSSVPRAARCTTSATWCPGICISR